MINFNKSDIGNQSCTLSFIEPIKQKLFQFNFHSTKIRKKNKDQETNDHIGDQSWAPVLSYKKLCGEPKFIMSLERRKARIISGIRDKQVEEGEKKRLGLVGGKVHNRNFKNIQNKIASSSAFELEYLVKKNEIALDKNLEFKSPKSPYMNFSLKYISDKKKGLLTQVKPVTRVSSAHHSVSQREKGSDSAYMMRLVSESHSKRQKARPQTSCLNDRKYRSQRPKSEMR